MWVYNTRGQDSRCWTGTCRTPLSGKSAGWVGGATAAPPGPAPHPPRPSPHPPPPPPGPSPGAAYDCAMRSYFVERAAQVNKNVGAARARQIADALAGDPSLPAGCKVRVPKPSSLRLREQGSADGRAAAAAAAGTSGTAVFADATRGNDTSGDGSVKLPYRTVGRALVAVRG